jgi:uncharacterized oligopeptide transporter (OPT) family protein
MKGRPNPAPDEGGKDSKGLVRWIVGAVLTVAVAGYMAGIVAGRIAEAQRLGLADLAVIVIAALLVQFSRDFALTISGERSHSGHGIS